MKNVINLPPHQPVVGSNVFVADTARVIGQVEIGLEASIWFGAVCRGDADSIKIGARTNVQDNAVLHADPGFPVVIGDSCIIGHSAIVHGARLENHVLIGMHATVLNGAQIGAFSIIGANALVTSNTIIPPYSLVLGSPAKVVGQIDTDGQKKILKNAEDYVLRARLYLENGF